METIPGRKARLPAGEDRLEAELLEKGPRERILFAMAAILGEDGYRAATVETIVKRATLSRATFYQHFDNREACALACFDRALDELARRVEAATAGRRSWPKRVAAGLTAFLELIAAEPDWARACLIEVVKLGEPGLERHEAALRRFAPLLAAGREERASGSRLPETLEETVLAGIVAMARRPLAQGDAGSVTDLLPAMTEFALTPYLGAARAAAAAAPR